MRSRNAIVLPSRRLGPEEMEATMEAMAGEEDLMATSFLMVEVM